IAEIADGDDARTLGQELLAKARDVLVDRADVDLDAVVVAPDLARQQLAREDFALGLGKQLEPLAVDLDLVTLEIHLDAADAKNLLGRAADASLRSSKDVLDSRDHFADR